MEVDEDLDMIPLGGEEEQDFSSLLIPVFKTCGKVPFMAGLYQDGKMCAYGTTTHREYVSPLFEFLWNVLITHASSDLFSPLPEVMKIAREMPKICHYPYTPIETLVVPNAFLEAVDRLRDRMFNDVYNRESVLWFFVYDSPEGFVVFGNSVRKASLHHLCNVIPFLNFLCTVINVRADAFIGITMEDVKNAIIDIEGSPFYDEMLEWCSSSSSSSAAAEEEIDLLFNDGIYRIEEGGGDDDDNLMDLNE
jgi:hypothetical protein